MHYSGCSCTEGKLYTTSSHPKSRNMWSSTRDTQRCLPFLTLLTKSPSEEVFIWNFSKKPKRAGGMSELKARKSDIKLVTANQVFKTRTTTGQDKMAIFFPVPPPLPPHFQKTSSRHLHYLQLTGYISSHRANWRMFTIRFNLFSLPGPTSCKAP